MTESSRTALREAAAANPHCSPHLLDVLSMPGEAQWTHLAAAGNPSSGDQTLSRLGHDTDTSVRVAVACNASAPEELIAELSRDAEAAVRGAGLAHRRTVQR